MITKISLVNIYHLTCLQFFFLVVRTSKIYSLSNFAMYDMVSLTILLTILLIYIVNYTVTMLYITSSELISFFFFLIFHMRTWFLLFIYLFLAMLGLRFCARAFSSCSKRGPLFIAVCGPLTIAASLVTEHRLQMHRLSSCGSQA